MAPSKWRGPPVRRDADGDPRSELLGGLLDTKNNAAKVGAQAVLSPRQRVWRHLMVATVNAAIERRLVERTGPAIDWPFEFEIGGRPAVGRVFGKEPDSIRVHASFRHPAPSAFAAGWLVRRDGFYLRMDTPTQFFGTLLCSNAAKALLADMPTEPLTFEDLGPCRARLGEKTARILGGNIREMRGRVLTRAEAAAVAGVNAGTLLSWMHRGIGPMADKTGFGHGRWRIAIEDLHRWIENPPERCIALRNARRAMRKQQRSTAA